jgi:hypothetical protein
MSGTEQEKAFLARAAEAIPGIPGYRERSGRRRTDEQLRDFLAGCIDDLVGKFDEIRSVADEEGDVDMVEDLQRLGERFGRTADALRTADYSGCGFFDDESPEDEQISRICGYDLAMLEDLELLSSDIGALKYESIGTLTLREVEGTLASIDLRVANRKDLFERSDA